MKNFARLQLLPTLLVVAATLSFVQCTKAASQVLWQIGKFDKSSLEFDQSVVPTPKPYTPHPVVYVIGKSQASEWPRFQPGSANGLAGFQPHPCTIRFDLPSTPHGVYTLKVALLVERPLVSRLEVAINGHRALFTQHPVLDYSAGDYASVFLPYYSADTITAEFPAGFLMQGTNEVVLTALDDSSVRDDSTDSGIFYDASSSSQDGDAKYAPNEDSLSMRSPPSSTGKRAMESWRSYWKFTFATTLLPREVPSC